MPPAAGIAERFAKESEAHRDNPAAMHRRARSMVHESEGE